MNFLIAGLLIALIVLVIILLLRTRSGGYEDKISSLLSERFLNFQASIQQTMENTRREVSGAKDRFSDHALKTLRTVGELRETTQKLVRQQEDALGFAEQLKYLLQSPKLRGNYGETVLEEMLDRVLPKGVWARQYAIDGGGIVDAVVLYRGVVLPIDSKFPREDYERYLQSENTQDKKANWKKYEDALKIQIRSIKEKYIKPEEGTTDFALMFIPSEAIYYETIAERNFLGDPCAIYEYARAEHVIPVSPNTFYAFLQIILMGVRNLELIRGAKELQEALSALERDFGRFYGHFEKIGKELEKSSEAYRLGEVHISRFRKRLDEAIKLELPEGEGDEGKDECSIPNAQ